MPPKKLHVCIYILVLLVTTPLLCQLPYIAREKFQSHIVNLEPQPYYLGTEQYSNPDDSLDEFTLSAKQATQENGLAQTVVAVSSIDDNQFASLVSLYNDTVFSLSASQDASEDETVMLMAYAPESAEEGMELEAAQKESAAVEEEKKNIVLSAIAEEESIKANEQAAVASVQNQDSYLSTIPLYTCGFSGDRKTLDPDLQRYLYQCLDARGIAWWYPYALCEAYGESRYNTQQITNGLDYGLWQFRIWYWDGRAAAAGLPGADPLNPYEETYVYAWFIQQKLNAAGGDVRGALKMYYDSGDDAVNEWYANYILQYVPTLTRIN